MTALHVAMHGADTRDGSASRPFRTINHAAQLARPGDTVIVHGGEYREWVRPRRGGLSGARRITYQAAPGEHVVIKGSEPVTGWERAPGGDAAGTVWRASIPNALFGDWNPFAEEVTGDWLVEPQPPLHKHLGDVYLDGLSFCEVGTREEVTDPPLRTEVLDQWTGATDRVRNPGQTRLVWYAEVGEDTIFDCGQNGIVGHLGCVFSTIEDNHIYNIALKREFYGHEIAGIKLHAAIDVQIRHNRINDCSLGTWLDWQTQGTRVSRNLYYRNNRDLFVEVSHGPYLVEHNVLASRASLESFSQGGAFVHNLIGGTVRLEPVMDRATPYHRPHSTQVAGYAVIYGGDDRYIGNVFLGGDAAAAYGPTASGTAPAGYGTAGYEGYPGTFGEYLARVAAQPRGDHQRFLGVKQPVYLRGNVYAPGARALTGEASAVTLTQDVSFEVAEEGDEVYLQARLPEAFGRARLGVVTGAGLPRVRLPTRTSRSGTAAR